MSDDGDNFDGNTTDDETITELTFDPSIEVTKTYSIIGDGDDDPEVGETIQFTINVKTQVTFYYQILQLTIYFLISIKPLTH